MTSTLAITVSVSSEIGEQIRRLPGKDPPLQLGHLVGWHRRADPHLVDVAGEEPQQQGPAQRAGGQQVIGVPQAAPPG